MILLDEELRRLRFLWGLRELTLEYSVLVVRVQEVVSGAERPGDLHSSDLLADLKARYVCMQLA